MASLPLIAFRKATFDWQRTLLMGVVNVTPDSFSDGGAFAAAPAAIARARALVADGADLVDVGGESTRPGAAPVSARDEAARVVPVVRALGDVAAVVSVDTYKAEVAAAALDAGAEIVNDISGGALDPDLLRVVARHGACVILGHLRGSPADMNAHARYTDIMRELRAELEARIDAAVAAGVPLSRIWIDPGIGFAKRAEHSVEVLARLGELRALERPIVVGASRKSFLGKLTGRDVGDRELGTAAANSAAVLAGAQVVRVHDVAGQRDAVRVADAIRKAQVAT